MAVPSVSSITETSFASNTTAHAVDMPATVDAGDLLLVFLAFDINPRVADPSGWTFINWTGNGTHQRGIIYAIDAVGDEDGTTVDFVTTVACSGSVQVYRITGWGGQLREHVWVSQEKWAAPTTTPDPPIVGIPWGSTEDTLAIASLMQDGDTAATVAPTGYGSLTTTASGGDGGVLATAIKTVNADSEDPGTFTATSEQYAAFTVVIAPTPYAAESGDSVDWSGAVWSRQGAGTTNHPASMPASVAVDDLLLVVLGVDGTAGTSNTPTGWTLLRKITTSGSAVLEIWGKKADGTEDGTDVTWTTAINENGAQIVLQIPADQWDGTLATDVDVSSGAGNSSAEATVNPDSVTTGWSGETNRFFAVGLRDGNSVAGPTAFPTNYDRHMFLPNGVQDSGERAHQLLVSSRENEADSEDPGTWTFAATRAWSACTIAVKPAAVAGAASPITQASSGNLGASATPTITEPAGTVVDDLLVAVIGSAGTGTAITGLTGWTQLGEGSDGANRWWYGWIIRGASAPDLVAAASNDNWTAMCYRVDGHDPTTPIGTDHANASASSNIPDPPNVDPGSVANRLSLAAVVQEGKITAWTPPSGYAEDQESNSSGGGGGATHVGGSIASVAIVNQAENPGTFGSTVTDDYTAFTILVSPASGPAPVTGELAETLAAYIGAATGIIEVTGSVAETLSDYISTAGGNAGVQGSVAETLDVIIGAAEGMIEIFGTVGATLDDYVSAGTGHLTSTGTIAETLDDYAGAGAGNAGVQGSIAEVLDDYAGAATGILVYTGTSGETLDTFVGAAEGQVTGPIDGTVAVTLENYISDGVGAFEVSGTVGVTLEDFVGEATGNLKTEGTVAETLEAYVSTATGVIEVTGTSGETLAAYTSTASGKIGVQGTLAETLENYVSAGVGVIEITGTVAETLDDFVGAGLGETDGVPGLAGIVGEKVW